MSYPPQTNIQSFFSIIFYQFHCVVLVINNTYIDVIVAVIVDNGNVDVDVDVGVCTSTISPDFDDNKFCISIPHFN